MSLKRFFNLGKLPVEVRKAVIRYYLTKPFGKTSDPYLLTAKNLLKLTEHMPHLKIAAFSEKELLLTSSATQFYARPYPSSDILTLKEVWGQKEYEPCIELLSKLKIHNPLVVDIGSNVGYSILYFAKNLSGAKFIAVEPDPENFRQLKKNMQANNLNAVQLIQGAWYTKNCRLSISTDYRGGTNASYYVAEKEDGPIQGYTLPELLNGNTSGIDLLKIDIEGTESLLLEDENKARDILKTVRVVAVEIHDDKANRTQIMKNLRVLGFNYFDQGNTTFAYRGR